MPLAVTHVLLTIIVLDLFRDYVIKDKKILPLSFIFIGGIAGLLPDIDIPIYWFMNNFLGIHTQFFHGTFTHNIIFPVLFLIASLIFLKFDKKLSILLGIVSFGWFFHLVLDLFITGGIMPFYPFSYFTMQGLTQILGIEKLPEGLDAIILLAWLWHEEKKHRISDFI